MFSPFICWFVFFVMSLVIPEAAYAQIKDLRQDIFIKDEAHYLNVSRVGTFIAYDHFDCTFECLSNPSCLSINLAASKGANGKLWCELLSSENYRNPEEYKENKTSHHFSIKSPCSSSPCKNNGKCKSLYQGKSYRCVCEKGFTGQNCETELKGCSQLRHDGFNSSGVYTVKPDIGKPMQVLCDMTTDGGGWTVFQRRLDGSVDFFLGWALYKNGFGDLNGEFWLGNDNLHRLTAADDLKLRVDLEDFDGNITYAEYTTFKVAEEGDRYRLVIGGYNGTAGDSMAGSQSGSGMQFTTKDNVRGSRNCADEFKGAWWYKDCHMANLNGQYLGGPHVSYADGINWYSFRGHYYSLKRTEMKIRPKI